MHVIFGYKVEIDEKATREWYDAASEWGCSCGSCRNFLTLAYKRELPAPVLAALDDLHIPPEKATYVCELYSDSKGSCYQFSYRIAGTIIDGNERVSARKSWGAVCCCHDLQIASPNGHLCHIRRPLRDLIGGQLGTH